MVNKVRLFSPISKLSIFVTRMSQNRVKRQHFICLLFLMTFGVSWIYIIREEPKIYSIYDYNRTNNILLEKLHETVLEDKGMGCDYPKLDPFSPELTRFDTNMPKVVCEGLDWVNCEKSQCYVVKEILNQMKKVSCIYKDILYISDVESKVGTGTRVVGNKNYTLTVSDYVKVSCSGKGKESIGLISSKWYGYKAGLREVVPQAAPPGREDSLNVLILGFDSTSRNGFIRRMPKSYKYLTEELGSILLKGYNIVGDATPAALFPILSGKSELEHPDTRVDYTKSYLDEESFIFHLLKNDGYRTAYFEDMPWIGTFQYRFNGFQRQPADHYLRAFLMEETKAGQKWWRGVKGRHCIGAMPQYLLFLNLTTQFHQLKGKKFSFTFIADITHDEFNLISTSDDDVVAFLKDFYESGRGEDTLLIVMGDHGPRWAEIRNSFYGKIEERQPLMSVRLPGRLARARPAARAHLRANAELLTTPFDVHSTVLDAMGLGQHANQFVVKGADYARALSLLGPIPKSRSCGEAGILPHWCLCIKWHNVTKSNPKYKQVVTIVVDFINNMVFEHRMLCAQRRLTSVEWVARGVTSNVTYSAAGRGVNVPFLRHYMGAKGANSNVEHYQAKIVLSPGKAVYEASVRYFVKEDSYAVTDSDVSRINAYGDEPHCISKSHPQLNKYCYCVKQLKRDSSEDSKQTEDVDL